MAMFRRRVQRTGARELREQGVPVQEIARDAGVSRSTAYRWLGTQRKDSMFKVMWKLFRPLTAVLLVWFGLRASHFALPLVSLQGVITLVAVFGMVAIEFAMSSDIGVKSFCKDLFFALFNLILATMLVTWLVAGDREVFVTDFVVWVCVLVDAYLGTTNSFRTALRNWSGQTNIGQTGENQ